MKMTVVPIVDFPTKFAQKEYFQSKAEKVSIAIEYCLLELVNVPKFTISKKIEFLVQICSKKVFWSEKEKVIIIIDVYIFKLGKGQIPP